MIKTIDQQINLILDTLEEEREDIYISEDTYNFNFIGSKNLKVLSIN